MVAGLVDGGLDPRSRQQQISQPLAGRISYGIHAERRDFDAPRWTTDFSGSIKKTQISDPMIGMPAVT
jgi:hypothetical protein